jgi:hypothetical protein
MTLRMSFPHGSRGEGPGATASFCGVVRRQRDRRGAGTNPPALTWSGTLPSVGLAVLKVDLHEQAVRVNRVG